MVLNKTLSQDANWGWNSGYNIHFCRAVLTFFTFSSSFLHIVMAEANADSVDEG